MKFSCSWLVLCLAGLMIASVPETSSAQKYGHLTGQFVLDGEIPKLDPPKLGEKDRNVCQVNPPLPNNRLIVDKDSKGIANVVIYLREAPRRIHPELKDSKEKEVVFDQKNCRFEPHILLVRTDQTVLVKSDDPINHNTHTHPFFNQELNFLVQPKDRKGVPVQYNQKEILPMQVNCDLHPHMKAYWLVLDHPYMAKTDADGRFRIENLPAGRYEFTIWHEKVGYIDRALKVSIKGDATEDLGTVKVPASKIKTD